MNNNRWTANLPLSRKACAALIAGIILAVALTHCSSEHRPPDQGLRGESARGRLETIARERELEIDQAVKRLEKASEKWLATAQAYISYKRDMERNAPYSRMKEAEGNAARAGRKPIQPLDLRYEVERKERDLAKGLHELNKAFEEYYVSYNEIVHRFEDVYWWLSSAKEGVEYCQMKAPEEYWSEEICQLKALRDRISKDFREEAAKG